jgi:hypothetical protein
MASRSIIVHSSSHHGRSRNTRTTQTGRKKNPLQPKILSLKFAKLGSPVSVYSRVRSISRNKIHTVTRVRGERAFRCTCERGVLRNERNCIHIRRVRAIATKLRKAAVR